MVWLVFSRLYCVSGGRLTCVNASFFKNRIIFHIIYLFFLHRSVPFSDNDLMISWFSWSPSLAMRNGLRLVSWPSVLWFAKLPSARSEMSCPSPRMCSGCIVNNGVVNIAYHFEPDWYPENISEEDRVEPVQAQLLQDISEWYVSFLLLSHAFKYAVICKCYCLC